MPQETNEMRLAIVERLIRFSQPIATSLEQLSSFDWDYVGQPYVIAEDHVISVLRRFLNDELNAHDVEDWADAIEVREDIAFDEATDWIQDTINLLSNPSINGEITSPWLSNCSKPPVFSHAGKRAGIHDWQQMLTCPLI